MINKANSHTAQNSRDEPLRSCTHFISAGSILFLVGEIIAFGQGNPEEDLDRWFSLLAQIGRYSSLEGAGSHGSIGFNIGAGLSITEMEKETPLSRNQSGIDSNDESPPPIFMRRFWLVKGMRWPVDVGFHGGASQTGEFSVASGHLQWTIYEALARPALALRLSHGRIFGLRTTAFQNHGVDLVGSYGFLRYFSLFAGIGLAQHRGSLLIERDAGIGYLLQEDLEQSVTERSWMSVGRFIGMRVQIVPPYIALSVERQSTTSGIVDEKQYMAKLSFGR